MQLNRDGAQHFAAALTPNDLLTLEHALQNTQQHGPGRRVSGIAALSTLLSPQGSIGRVAASFLGPEARAVRALLFNKTAENNWALGWHQDRTISVRERVETPGFTNWTVKAGMHHVEPPFDLLEGMLTLRVHLDPVGPRNAPLLIAPRLPPLRPNSRTPNLRNGGEPRRLRLPRRTR